MTSKGRNITQKKVIQILGVKSHATDITTEKGVLMGQNAEVSEHCFLYQVNDPASLSTQTKINEISNSADINLLTEIFGCMNGLNAFRSLFSIYGWIESLDRSDPYATHNIPYNIVDLQVESRPRYAPAEGCAVATLKTSIANDKRSNRIVDVIMPNNLIVGGYFYENSEILDKFDNVEAWLSDRFRLAKTLYSEECQHFFPR